MLRRLLLPRRNVFPHPLSSSPPPTRRAISVKSTIQRVANPGPPVLARYPLLYNTLQCLKYGLGFTLGAHVFVDYFYAIHGTWGVSMVPTLAASGDSVIISKYYRHGRDVQVGDIVSFKHPMREDMRASKRVVGMPGDFVLRDTPEKGQGMMIQVPQGHCWVVGDNLSHSRDSRMFGPLPLALIRGKVVGIFRGWTLLPERVPDALVDAADDVYAVE